MRYLCIIGLFVSLPLALLVDAFLAVLLFPAMVIGEFGDWPFTPLILREIRQFGTS